MYWLWVRGFSYATIARTHGLSARQSRRIIEAYRQGFRNPLGDEDELERVQQYRSQYDALIAELAMAALEARTPSQKGRLIDLRRRALDDRVEFEQRLGLLPSPGRLSSEGVSALLLQLRNVCRLHDAPPELKHDIIKVFLAWADREGTPLLPDASDILQA